MVGLGLGEDAIDGRLRKGRLHRLHGGVYSVGHRVVAREGRWLAAVLASGEGAVLSHRSAAALWGIVRQEGGRINVSSPRTLRSFPSIRRHEVGLSTDEVTRRRQIPVTTLVRTLLDVAAETSDDGFEAAVREAEYMHRLRLENLEELLERHRGKRGAKRVRTCLHRLGWAPHGRTRSKLEDRFAALLARTDLPMPSLNALLDIDGFKVQADCLWREQRLIAELDGVSSHGTRTAFESDRERDRHLQVAGWRVIRITWRQLDAPKELLADLRRLLAAEPAIARHTDGK